MGCGSAGDAFSVDTMDCSLEAPCLVEYDTKGRAWQGFSDAYPGNHIWTATPSDYEGQQVRTVHDTEVRTARDIPLLFAKVGKSCQAEHVCPCRTGTTSSTSSPSATRSTCMARTPTS